MNLFLHNEIDFLNSVMKLSLLFPSPIITTFNSLLTLAIFLHTSAKSFKSRSFCIRPTKPIENGRCSLKIIISSEIKLNGTGNTSIKDSSAPNRDTSNDFWLALVALILEDLANVRLVNIDLNLFTKLALLQFFDISACTCIWIGIFKPFFNPIFRNLDAHHEDSHGSPATTKTGLKPKFINS